MSLEVDISAGRRPSSRINIVHREVEPGLRRQDLQLLDRLPKLPIFEDSAGEDIEEIPNHAHRKVPKLTVSDLN